MTDTDLEELRRHDFGVACDPPLPPTEAMTHGAATHVPDDVRAGAARHFDEEKLANLAWAIGAMRAGRDAGHAGERDEPAAA
jgi:hypothetical protein